MERNRFWIFIVIAILFGGAMELMKRSDDQPTKRIAVRLEDIEDAGPIEGYDARAGRIEGAVDEEVPKVETTQVAGLMPSTPSLPPTQATPETSAFPTAPTDAKAAAAADKKKKDAKKLADKKKKKAKKKKKTIKGKEDSAPASPGETEDSDDVETAEATPATPIQTAGPGTLPAAQNNNNDIPQTQRDWENLLLTEPDFKAVEKLIKFHNSKMVSSEIFYNVVAQMVGDSRPKMRQLGVVALGATPNPRSFIALAEIVHEERGVTPVKTQAQGYMNRYTEIGYLRYLGSVLNANTSNAASLEALRVFRVAIDRHLKPLQTRLPAENGQTDQSSVDAPAQGGMPPQGVMPPQSGSGAPQPGDQPVAKKQPDVYTFFRPFVPLLIRLQDSYTERDLKQAATAALSSLTSMLPAIAADGTPTPGQPPGQAPMAPGGQPMPNSYPTLNRRGGR